MVDIDVMSESRNESQIDVLESIPGPAWRAAEAAGMDMGLVELSLTKTPWERIQEHDRALAQANLLRNALRQQHGTT